MPFRDGTGPSGFGSRTGRRRGWCCTDIRAHDIARVLSTGRRGWLWGMVAPVAVAAVRDIVNPSGLLRRFVRACLAGKQNASRIIRDAEFTIVEKKNNSLHANTQPDNRE